MEKRIVKSPSKSLWVPHHAPGPRYHHCTTEAWFSWVVVGRGREGEKDNDRGEMNVGAGTWSGEERSKQEKGILYEASREGKEEIIEER